MSSCYYDNREELYQNFQQTQCDTSVTTFAAVILPILQDNCATSGCHVGNNPQSGLDFSTYDDAQLTATDGRLVGRITGSSGPIMPPGGPLPNCEIEKIKRWVNKGARNN